MLRQCRPAYMMKTRLVFRNRLAENIQRESKQLDAIEVIAQTVKRVVKIALGVVSGCLVSHAAPGRSLVTFCPACIKFLQSLLFRVPTDNGSSTQGTCGGTLAVPLHGSG